MSRRFGIGAVLCFSLMAACSNGSEPSNPSPPSNTNLTGTWLGTASDSTGPGQMTWQVTQSGGTVTGTLTITDTASGLGGRGAVSGTLSGSRIRFTLTVPAGGFDPPHAACTSEVTGDADVAGTTITGTYSGTSSCAGTIGSGQLTLNKS